MESKPLILARFGEIIIAEAKKKNLSLRKLADASGLEYSQVQRIAKGKVNLALTTIVALCEGLEISPSELFKNFR
ncbi:helix-turn-helix domain-containing protein [Dyadobacter jiangsuensis]